MEQTYPHRLDLTLNVYEFPSFHIPSCDITMEMYYISIERLCLVASFKILKSSLFLIETKVRASLEFHKMLQNSLFSQTASDSQGVVSLQEVKASSSLRSAANSQGVSRCLWQHQMLLPYDVCAGCPTSHPNTRPSLAGSNYACQCKCAFTVYVCVPSKLFLFTKAKMSKFSTWARDDEKIRAMSIVYHISLVVDWIISGQTQLWMSTK